MYESALLESICGRLGWDVGRGAYYTDCPPVEIGDMRANCALRLSAGITLGGAAPAARSGELNSIRFVGGSWKSSALILDVCRLHAATCRISGLDGSGRPVRVGDVSLLNRFVAY